MEDIFDGFAGAAGKTRHWTDEGMLRSEVDSAAFKLVAEGNLGRNNPSDPRDLSTQQPAGPPDNFVLKFQKPLGKFINLVAAGRTSHFAMKTAHRSLKEPSSLSHDSFRTAVLGSTLRDGTGNALATAMASDAQTAVKSALLFLARLATLRPVDKLPGDAADERGRAGPWHAPLLQHPRSHMRRWIS